MVTRSENPNSQLTITVQLWHLQPNNLCIIIKPPHRNLLIKQRILLKSRNFLSGEWTALSEDQLHHSTRDENVNEYLKL